MSRFKNIEGVRNDVTNTLNKPGTGRRRFAKKKPVAPKPPPMKVKIKSTKSGKLSRKEESKMSKKPPMKKSVSMFQKKKKVPEGNTNLRR